MKRLNLEALTAMLSNSLGEEAVSGLEFDEDTLATLMIDDEDTVDTDDVDNDEDNGDEDADNDNDNEYDDEDEAGLEDIDVDKLTVGERILYDTLMKERKRADKEALNALISTSGVGTKHREVLRRMIKNGVAIKDIKDTIEDFKEVENTSTRVLGKKRVVPKSKVKTNILKKKDDKPKIGSKEYGKLLAAKRR